jgi:hypothetical protein
MWASRCLVAREKGSEKGRERPETTRNDLAEGFAGLSFSKTSIVD